MQLTAETIPPTGFTTDRCVAHLRSLLPKEAFAPAPKKLLYMLAHLAAVFACFFGIASTDNVLLWPLFSLVIGNSFTCILFYSHELAHHTILPRHRLAYVCEVIFFTPISIPATMWRRIHNHSHHVYVNTLRDPDRFFTKSELSAKGGLIRTVYTRLFYPHRLNRKWSPLVGCIFITWVLRHTIAALYPRDYQPTIVTYKPHYSVKQRWLVISEIAVIAAFHAGILWFLGGFDMRWFFAIPVSYCVGSSIGMAYIWTQHYLHELGDDNDILENTTSIEVPWLFDRLHTYMSYHVEHHLFPGMNSEYYPRVSELLKQHYPDHYKRISIREAWRRLWKIDEFIREAR